MKTLLTQSIIYLLRLQLQSNFHTNSRKPFPAFLLAFLSPIIKTKTIARSNMLYKKRNLKYNYVILTRKHLHWSPIFSNVAMPSLNLHLYENKTPSKVFFNEFSTFFQNPFCRTHQDTTKIFHSKFFQIFLKCIKEICDDLLNAQAHQNPVKHLGWSFPQNS